MATGSPEDVAGPVSEFGGSAARTDDGHRDRAAAQFDVQVCTRRLRCDGRPRRWSHCQRQLPRRAAGLDLLRDAFEANSLILQARHDLEKVRQATTKPIESLHHESVPSSQRLQTLVKLLSNSRLSARRLFADGTDPSQAQRVALQV